MRGIPIGWAVALSSLGAGLVCAQTPAREIWHSLEIPGGTAGLAQAAGLDPGLPRWQSFHEVTRRLDVKYGDGASAARLRENVRAYLVTGAMSPRRAARMAAGPLAIEARGDAELALPSLPPATTAPLPMAPAVWSNAVFGRPLSDGALALAILSDRAASLLYRGLVQLDPPTLAVLEGDPETLREVYRRHGEAFSVFAGSFHVRDGRVDTPGGPDNTPLWESVVGQDADQPGRFLERLLERNDGRTAFLYDAVARLDPAGQRFALGSGQPAGERGERFRALAAVFAGGEAWWRPQAGAFNRSGTDAATMLRLVRVDASGRPTGPTGRAFWTAAFDDAGVSDQAALRASDAVDAAWLAERIGQGPPWQRRERLVKLLFAQRVFGEAAGETLGDVLRALRALGREPALALTLERMGFVAPRLYADVARKAEQIASVSDRESGPVTMALFQGGLALVERARLRHTLDVRGAESLVRSLVAVPVPEGRYGSGVARWLRESALPAFASAIYGSLPPGSSEQVVTRALAGAVLARQDAGRAFEWEGLFYRADDGEGERQRLEQVRRRQGGNSLDAVLDFSRAVEDLESATGVREVAAGLARAQAAARALEPPVYPDGKALGVPRSLSSLNAAAERVLAEALLSLAYAPHLGPPDGSVLAGGNVALRHRFEPLPWAVAEETPQMGVPWHVRGALVGLDNALAGLSLRRLSMDMPLRPPALDGRARLAFARLVTLMDPGALDDGAPAAIAAAIERGRSRAARLAGAPGEAAEAAREAAIGAWRSQALAWVIAHEPAALPRFFTLLELFRLGRPGPGPWNGWGAPGVGEDGAWRLRLPEARPFDDLAGRRLDDLLPARFADLGLKTALDLHARGLPAALAPGLLAYLVQDMVEGAEPRFHDDWVALVRFVQDIPPERMDDIVSAQASGGALVPAPAPGDGQ